MNWPFERGQRYNRRQEIHARYGGQQQGGIITPADHPLVICITGHEGEQHGYSDAWTPDGAFAYFGEGQVGDMELVRGNAAILRHSEAGKSLLLFQKQSDGSLRFEGEFVCGGYETADAPDRERKMRKAIVFNLVPVEISDQPADQLELPPAGATLDQLRDAALAAAAGTATANPKQAVRNVHQRSSLIRRYVLERARGRCELCDNDAPFARPDGSPYLEPHHIRRLSDGGPDDPRFMGAICPNCHRSVHFGNEGPQLNSELLRRVTAIETR